MLLLGFQLELPKPCAPLDDRLIADLADMDFLPFILGVDQQKLQCNRQTGGLLVLLGAKETRLSARPATAQPQ
jgi:hypothetical protein